MNEDAHARGIVPLASGADRDRTGDPLVAKPIEKVPRFYKLLNLRAVLGIGVVVQSTIWCLISSKLTTRRTTVERGLRPHPPKRDPRSDL